MFRIARDHDRYAKLDEIVEAAEIEGAHSVRSRDAIELFESLDCPIAICTANAERAATIALERFDVLRHVDTTLARDTIPEDKPHARTLLACLEALNVEPGDALYVGDESVDEELAVNAGSSYADPEYLTFSSD